LVYENFIGDIDKNKIIHHKDGNKENNHISNLIQIDFFEHNNIHKREAWNKGLKGFMSGKRDSAIYKTRRKKIICAETGIIFNSVTDAAKTINKSINLISSCLTDNKKTAGGYHFEYFKNSTL
jgi:hypothetical protein